MALTSARCELLPFPGEIRNKIYLQVFESKKYLILWPVAGPTDSTPPGTAADLALLRVSKATREEAMSVMYANCCFRYLLDFAVEVHSPLPPLHAVKLMNDITLDFEGAPVEETAQRCVVVLKMLAGISMPCGKLRIFLNVQQLRAWTPDLPPIRIFSEALKSLKDFRAVIIVIFHVNWSHRPVSLVSEWLKERMGCPFGSPIEGEMKIGRNIGYAQFLQYHPRKHVLGSVDKKAARLEARAANLGTQADWRRGDSGSRIERSQSETVSIS